MKIDPDEMRITAIREMRLKPFGRFSFTYKRNLKNDPMKLECDTLTMYSESIISTTKADGEMLLKAMKKKHTDVLTWGREFWTMRGTNELIRIDHKRLQTYVSEHCKMDYFLGTWIGKDDALANPMDY